MKSKMFTAVMALLATSIFSLPASAAPPNPKVYIPFPPFRIAGNLYYVGSQELASFLISTPQGLILINTGFIDSTPIIEKSIEQLGFHMNDVKIILVSHVHNDHAAGVADLVKRTGAGYYVMDRDVDVAESGGKTDYFYGDNPNEQYPPAHVDHVLHDGATVGLGGTVLTAHLTPGHTKGNITWTFNETEDGRVLHVVIMGSPLMNRGMQVYNNPKYPEAAEDFEKGFAVLRSLPCDVFLGSHGWYFDIQEKYDRFIAGDKNAFIDPAGYKAYIDDAQKKFEAELKKQKAEAQTAPKPRP